LIDLLIVNGAYMKHHDS